MSRMSLKMKLAVGFGVLLVILAALGTVAYNSLLQLDQMALDVEQRGTEKTLVTNVALALMTESSGTRGFLLNGSAAGLGRMQEGQRLYKDSIGKLSSNANSDEAKRLYAEVQRTYENYHAIVEKAIEAKRVGKMKEALDLVAQAGPASQELAQAVGNCVARADAAKQKIESEQNAKVDQYRAIVPSLTVAGIVIGVIVALLIARSIASGVARMAALIKEIASNNLAVEDTEVATDDEIGRACLMLNEMKNNLRQIIRSIAGAASRVASAAEEISAAAARQSEGAETQKDQSTQAATAMQEMASTVQQVSENSNKAAEASNQAAETARHGGSIVDETLTKMRGIATEVSGTARKMEELGKSSDQIGRIIGVIDDIADQTNLLALNAAIEAARAGEQDVALP